MHKRRGQKPPALRPPWPSVGAALPSAGKTACAGAAAHGAEQRGEAGAGSHAGLSTTCGPGATPAAKHNSVAFLRCEIEGRDPHAE